MSSFLFILKGLNFIIRTFTEEKVKWVVKLMHSVFRDKGYRFFYRVSRIMWQHVIVLVPKGSMLDSGLVYVAFVVDVVALGQVFPPRISVYPCHYYAVDP